MGEKTHRRGQITLGGRWGLRKSQGWRHFGEEQVVAQGTGMNVWAVVGTWQGAPRCLRPRTAENR